MLPYLNSPIQTKTVFYARNSWPHYKSQRKSTTNENKEENYSYFRCFYFHFFQRWNWHHLAANTPCRARRWSHFAPFSCKKNKYATQLLPTSFHVPTWILWVNRQTENVHVCHFWLPHQLWKSTAHHDSPCGFALSSNARCSIKHYPAKDF